MESSAAVHNGFETRIKTTEEQAARTASEQISGFQGLWKRSDAIDEKISALEKWTATGLAPLDMVQQLTQRVDGAISWQERMKLPERFNDIDVSLSKNRVELSAVRNISGRAIEMLPSYFKHQECIGVLKIRLESAIDEFLSLCNMYGSSQPATAPFSNWRPTSGAVPNDPAIQMAERLAQSLEVYVQQAQSYAIRWKGDPFSGVLFVLIAQWRQPPTNDVSADRLLMLLREQYTNLQKIESSYAALWIKEVKESATIS